MNSTVRQRMAAVALVAAMLATGCSTFTWGRNTAGQLGNGTTVASADPAEIALPGTDSLWIDADAGQDHTCQVRGDRTLWCWGENADYQLGDGTSTDRTSPTQAMGANWSTVAAGHDYSCGIKADNTLWCWGANEFGQLGDGTTTLRTAPTQVGTGTDWQHVSTSLNRVMTAGFGAPDLAAAHTCATKTDDTLWCWGSNGFAQLGTGSAGADELSPVPIGAGQSWEQVVVGNLQTCALRSDGTLWCTGQYSAGELVPLTELTQLGTDTDWDQFDMGPSYGLFEGFGFAQWASANHTCALKTDDTLWCWGWNNGGQVGSPIVNHIDTLIPPLGAFETTPLQVGTESDWVAIATGPSTTCGIRAATAGNQLWCWGLDYGFEPTLVDLGAQPIQVAMGTGFRAVRTL